jgi:hypothetical protein
MGIISTIKNNWKPYTIGFILVLLLTNPSHEDFTNRLSIIIGTQDNYLVKAKPNTVYYGQKMNLFVCSFYQCEITFGPGAPYANYLILGILGNFIILDDNWDS